VGSTTTTPSTTTETPDVDGPTAADRTPCLETSVRLWSTNDSPGRVHWQSGSVPVAYRWRGNATGFAVVSDGSSVLAVHRISGPLIVDVMGLELDPLPSDTRTLSVALFEDADGDEEFDPDHDGLCVADGEPVVSQRRTVDFGRIAGLSVELDSRYVMTTGPKTEMSGTVFFPRGNGPVEVSVVGPNGTAVWGPETIELRDGRARFSYGPFCPPAWNYTVVATDPRTDERASARFSVRDAGPSPTVSPRVLRTVRDGNVTVRVSLGRCVENRTVTVVIGGEGVGYDATVTAVDANSDGEVRFRWHPGRVGTTDPDDLDGTVVTTVGPDRIRSARRTGENRSGIRTGPDVVYPLSIRVDGRETDVGSIHVLGGAVTGTVRAIERGETTVLNATLADRNQVTFAIRYAEPDVYHATVTVRDANGDGRASVAWNGSVAGRVRAGRVHNETFVGVGGDRVLAANRSSPRLEQGLPPGTYLVSAESTVSVVPDAVVVLDEPAETALSRRLDPAAVGCDRRIRPKSG